MTAASLSVEVSLGMWLAVTAVKQAGAWSPALLDWFRYDVLRLIPGWTFFAPNPAVSEVRFFVRFRVRADGKTYGDWLEPDLIRSQARRLPESLFHPRRRIEKELADLADFLRTPGLTIGEIAGYSDVIAMHALCARMAEENCATAWEFVLAEGDRGSGDVETMVLTAAQTLNRDECASSQPW